MKTKSESLFEGFLATNNLLFKKIEEDTASRPDYRVSVGGSEIIFELKELAEDGNFDVVKDPAHPHTKSSSRTVGDHIRRRIESSRKQIQFGAKQGIPSILLIYNDIDPVFQDFGTEPMDLTAAMYGAYTIVINRETKIASDWFNVRMPRTANAGSPSTASANSRTFADSANSLTSGRSKRLRTAKILPFRSSLSPSCCRSRASISSPISNSVKTPS